MNQYLATFCRFTSMSMFSSSLFYKQYGPKSDCNTHNIRFHEKSQKNNLQNCNHLTFFYIYWYCQVLLGKYNCANQVNIDDLLFNIFPILWGSFVSIFVVLCITVSFLVLQSPWRGRESCLLCYCCLADVLLLYMLCSCSSLCCALVCSMRLWYLLIILTYFLKILKTCLI